MYVLYILTTTKQGLCADSTGEFIGTTGQEVSKWDSLGITGQLSNKQEASNIHWDGGVHDCLNREVGWRRWQKSKSLDIFKEK